MTETAIRKHSVVINGHHTSVSLETEFYEEVKRMAENSGRTVAQVIEGIAAGRTASSLSSEIRLAVLRYLRSLAFPQAPSTAPEMAEASAQ